MVDIGLVSTADGSAQVKLGNSTVLADTKLEPVSTEGRKGVIKVKVEVANVARPPTIRGEVDECGISDTLQNVLAMEEIRINQCCSFGTGLVCVYLDLYICTDVHTAHSIQQPQELAHTT